MFVDMDTKCSVWYNYFQFHAWFDVHGVNSMIANAKVPRQVQNKRGSAVNLQGLLKC